MITRTEASDRHSTQAATPYLPGRHVIVDGEEIVARPLADLAGFRAMIEHTVRGLGLVSVGAVHHGFDGGGFTSVVCLTESHLSIHTWPEHGRVTFDVFLSNFSRDNDEAGEALVAAITAFLGHGRYTRNTLHR